MLDDASPEGRTNNAERDTGNGDPASPTLPSDKHGIDPSLSDDITALLEDGKAYAQAELAFQKSRAAFAAHEVKTGAGFALVMLAFFHLALMGAVVGLILGLAPLVGAFAATGIVVGILILCTALFGWLAMSRFKKISRAFDNDPASDDAGDAA